jgi:murein DD-endopeptidase MepM/ murein hydrolase activator NlpD
MLGRTTQTQNEGEPKGKPQGKSKGEPTGHHRRRRARSIVATVAALISTTLTAVATLTTVATVTAPPAAASTSTKAPALQFPWQEGLGHRITGSGYNCGGHTGTDAFALDFNFASGTPVTAAATGHAHTAVDLAGALYVWVDHGNGFVSTYFHLSSFAVSGGQWVNQGQIIGNSGNTGNSSGPHLHFAVHQGAFNTGTGGAAYRPEPMYGPYRGGNSGFGSYGVCAGASSPVYTSKPGCPSGGSSTVFPRATTNGYYMVGQDGGVYAFGGAPFQGSAGSIALNAVMTGMARTYDNQGYWLVGADGGIFAYNAPFNGSAGSLNLASCIQGMAARSNGHYWLVAADGGVFAYPSPGGSYYGSMGGQPLNARIQGMAATPDGGGYWLVGADGGVFNYGNAPFLGSLAGQSPNPVTAIASSPTGRGYWLLKADGTVVGFGDAAGFGSVVAPIAPAIGIAPTVNGDGYWVTLSDGQNYAFGAARDEGSLYGNIGAPVTGNAGLHGTPPSFNMNAAPPTTVIPPGTSGNVTITVTAGTTFQGTVSLSTSGVPSGSSASLTPAALALNQNQSGTSTLRINRGLSQINAFTMTVTGCGNGTCKSVSVTVN